MLRLGPHSTAANFARPEGNSVLSVPEAGRSTPATRAGFAQSPQHFPRTTRRRASRLRQAIPEYSPPPDSDIPRTTPKTEDRRVRDLKTEGRTSAEAHENSAPLPFL